MDTLSRAASTLGCAGLVVAVVLGTAQATERTSHDEQMSQQLSARGEVGEGVRDRIARKRAQSKERGEKPRLHAYDQPREAMQFFVDQRREPGMTGGIPQALYDQAKQQADALSGYSLSQDRFVENTGSRAPMQGLAPWTALGPGNVGGRTRVLRFRPGTPSTMYMGAAGGGLWRSTDSGATWAPFGDLLANLAIGAMAIETANPDNMYVGTGEGFYGGDSVAGGGIFRSTDGGVTWTLLPATAPSFTGAGGDFRQVTDLVMSPNSNQRLYATTHSGMFRSLDAGATWTKEIDANPPTPGVAANACTDIEIATTGPNDTVLVACGTFAPTGTNTGIWRSTAANTAAPAWSKRIGPSPGAGGTALTLMGRASLKIAPSNQNIVYAVVACSQAASGDCDENGGPPADRGKFNEGLRAVYRSINGGDTWSLRILNDFDETNPSNLLFTNPFAEYCFPAKGFTQGWYDNHIHVDPTNTNRVFVGGVDIWRSDDGGATWGTISYWWTEGDVGKPYAHADQHSFAFHPNYNGTTETRIYAGNDGGLFVSSDAHTSSRATTYDGFTFGNHFCPFLDANQNVYVDAQVQGATWASLNTGYQVTQFYHGVVYPDGTTYMGGTQDNGTNRRIEASQGINQWNEVSGGDGGYASVNPANTNNITVEYTGISIDRSVNGGTTLTCGTNGIVLCTPPFTASDTGLFINPVSMDPNDGNRLWTSGSFMWRSNNHAQNWSRANNNVLTAGELYGAHAVAPTNSNLVIAGTVLNDAGNNGGRLFLTTAGTTATSTTAWTACGVARPTAGTIASVAFDPNSPKIAGVIQPATAIIYATYSNFSGDRVWKSINGCTSFTAIDDANGDGIGRLPAVPVHTIVADPVYPAGERLYVGTDLGVFVTIDGGNTWARENSQFSNTPVELLVLHNRQVGTRAAEEQAKSGNLSKAAATGELFAFTHGRSVFKTSLRAAGSFCATTVPATILDNNASGVNINLNTSDIVAVGSTITDLNITLNATHATPSDLRATLTHVGSGTTITLFNNGTGCTTANVGALFDDDADYTAAFRCGSAPPLSTALTGTIKPVGALSTFSGLAYTGTWRLNVADLVATGGANGTVTGFCLTPTANSDATVPVNLGFVKSQRLNKDLVQVEFETASAIGVAGFEISAQRGGEHAARMALEQESHETQTHRLNASISGDSFYLRVVNADGSVDVKGPFVVGQSRGRALGRDAIARADWRAIRAERASAAQRQVRGSRAATSSTAQAAAIDLLVTRDGIQRVTHAQLQAAGASAFEGAPVAELALSLNGQAQAIRVSSNDALFNSGDSIEFIGRALRRPSESASEAESLYGAAQPYRLSRDANLAKRVVRVRSSDEAATDLLRAPVSETVEDNLQFAYVSPLRDPWAWMRAVSSGGVPNEVSRAFDLGAVDSTRIAQLSATLYGGTDLSGAGPDHHAELWLNGVRLGDAQFDGLNSATINASLPAGLLRSGSNSIALRLPGDTGQAFDVVYLEDVALSYSQQLQAMNGRLNLVSPEGSGQPIPDGGGSGDVLMADGFENSAPLCAGDQCRRLSVAGLEASSTRVYQEANGQWYEVPFIANGNGVRFTTPVSSGHRFEIADASGIATPELRAVADASQLLSGNAQYLVITHPQFADALAPLLSQRQAEGLSTKLVNVDAIYEHYRQGVTDAAAIRQYIGHARNQLGTQYVLLVGGDTYDYRDDLELGSVSFVPTLYTANGAFIRHAASDALLADGNNDRVPDLAIGRLPVRSVAELNGVLAKMQVFAQSTVDRMVFVADETSQGLDFDVLSDVHRNAAQGNAIKVGVHLDALGVTAAKSSLVSEVNSGARYLEYLGHSAPGLWSYAPLLTNSDINGGIFNNAATPMLVNQLGCWNGFFVDPNGATMSHAWLFGVGGAAAAMGASGLIDASSGHAFGQRFMQRLTNPARPRIGDAILQSKQSLQQDGVSADDVQMFTTLLGDPAMRY